MPHRSGPARVAILGALALVAAAPGAARAAAAEPKVAVPADAPVVAGPTASGATLRAFLHRGELCAVVVDPKLRAATRVSVDQSCGPVPVLSTLGQEQVNSANGAFDVQRIVGVTGTDVAAVEARALGRPVARAETRPSPLPGAAADLRFYLLEGAEPAAAPDELAFLDAAGTVRRASDEELYDLLEDDADERPGATPLLTRRTTIARGGRGKARWTLSTRIKRVLEPTPLEPERRVPVPCLAFATAGGGSSSGCVAQPDDRQPVVTGLDSECPPLGWRVTAVAAPGVRRVVVVGGSGRRFAVGLHPVPDAPAGTRAGVALLGTGEAARSVVATGAGGRVVYREELALAPTIEGGGDCGGLLVSLGAERPSVVDERLGAGPHAVAAVDHDVLLCTAVDRAPRVPGDCAPAPIEGGDVRRWPAAGGSVVAGVVAADIASVRLTLDDGRTLDAPAGPIAGYAGRYRDVVRQVLVELPAGRRAVATAFRDARGRTLYGLDAVPDLPQPRDVSTILRVPGLPPLRAATLPRAGTFGPYPCLTLGGARGACQIATRNGFTAEAQCGPRRRIVIRGLLPHRTSRLDVVLRGGRRIAARTAPMPRAVVRDGAAAVAVLPASAEPTGLVVRGRGGGRARLVLPAAARQCGYRASTQVLPPQTARR